MFKPSEKIWVLYPEQPDDPVIFHSLRHTSFGFIVLTLIYPLHFVAEYAINI